MKNQILCAEWEHIAAIKPLCLPRKARYAMNLVGGGVNSDFVKSLKTLPQHLARGDDPVLLREAWQYSSSYLCEMFGIESMVAILEEFGRVSMETEDYEYFALLEDPILIFRGGDDANAAVNALAWSTSSDFAQVHATEQRQSVLVTATTSRKDVLAAYCSEMEVIVRPGAATIVSSTRL